MQRNLNHNNKKESDNNDCDCKQPSSRRHFLHNDIDTLLPGQLAWLGSLRSLRSPCAARGMFYGILLRLHDINTSYICWNGTSLVRKDASAYSDSLSTQWHLSLSNRLQSPGLLSWRTATSGSTGSIITPGVWDVVGRQYFNEYYQSALSNEFSR